MLTQDAPSSLEKTISNLFPTLEEVPPEFQLQTPIHQREYLLNGELRTWSGETEVVQSPILVKINGELQAITLGDFPLFTPQQALEALDAAVKAFDNGKGAWAKMSVSDRIHYVQEFTFRMKAKRKEVVTILMWEICKSQKDAEKEFDRTIEYIEATINALKDLDRNHSRFLIEQGVIGQIRRAPLGVILCMGPSNYPLNETFTTFIPALIMGNTTVIKPPRPGTLLFYPLLEAFQCFPPGVVNTIYGKGREILAPLMETGKVDGIAFIGSSKAANFLDKQHPKPNRLRTILGLEAKNPAIILPDANLSLAVKECLLGTLSYNGQRCTALKILFVHSQIVERFLEDFSQAIAQLKIGVPWLEDVMITPLPELDKPKYFTDLVTDAQSKGANIINPAGGIVNGSFFYPAVLYPVTPTMRIYHEEQFGPVIPVVKFDDICEPIQYMVDSNYGQQVSLFGQNPDEIAKLVDHLVNQVCRVNLNSQCQRGPDTFPFTGRKDSAEGTLSVTDALRSFSIRTLVAAKETDPNKQLLGDIVRERKSNFLSTDFIL
jgi:glyceraldehyde-3-phosphate dehydrogenase (NADP+)